jgi:hypothetical protein
VCGCVVVVALFLISLHILGETPQHLTLTRARAVSYIK